jgi:hypothetical protein
LSTVRDVFGLTRRPIGIAALLVISMLFAGAAIANRAAALDADARADLAEQLDALAADLDRVNERTAAARAVAADAQECVTEEASRLQPALAASARFSITTVALSNAVMARAALPAEPAATEVVVALTAADDDLGRDELVAQLAHLRDVRAEAGAEAQGAELRAVERHAACEAAHRAVAAVVAEVGPRTDAVISASGMAPAETVAELRATRDAVLAGEGDGSGADELPRWLAAASAVEATHATANAAAIEAAARAAEAARQAEQAAQGGSWSGGLYRPGETTLIEIVEVPPVDWCEIEPDLIAYWDPVTGEPVPACY